ncbi:MAG: asparaginase [Rhodothermales bacterium]|nr:asparaginase [Rhodothermales bacterium]MBO6778417.1 asparaginase [Rhodothermales bacterium]
MPEAIAILSTGGTIDKVYFDAQSDYEVGEPQIAEILRMVGAQVPYTVHTLFRKDSLDLTDADRQVIRQMVLATDADRILITHGTDTMVETAEVLSDVAGKTIVLVGSLTPARFKNSDAEFNIGFAIAAVQTLPSGVFIAMNGCVFPYDKVRKNRKMNRFEEVV